MDALETGLGVGWRYFWYAFVTVFTIMLLVSFGLALSHLKDAGVLVLGFVALTACIIAVGVQGIYVWARLDASQQVDSKDVSARDADVYVVRSYSLTLQPDKMRSLRGEFTASSILVSMNERAFVTKGGKVYVDDVSYSSDAGFLVVAKGAASDRFRTDVMDSRISTLLLGGSVLRVISVTALDFAHDDHQVARNIALGNDIYIVAARGSAGSTPVDTSTTSLDILMPWSGLRNVSASAVLSPLYEQTGGTFPIQVWGIGGR